MYPTVAKVPSGPTVNPSFEALMMLERAEELVLNSWNRWKVCSVTSPSDTTDSWVCPLVFPLSCASTLSVRACNSGDAPTKALPRRKSRRRSMNPRNPSGVSPRVILPSPSLTTISASLLSGARSRYPGYRESIFFDSLRFWRTSVNAFRSKLGSWFRRRK